jgi:cytosine/adenosine deaminase-related metal-dependent hydrolase
MGKGLSLKDIDLRGYLLLPGLINAHDHLEFALFPRLGNGPYPNAGAWAADIHKPDESPVREQRAVPRETRLLWGAVRNLATGVTTVVHHNPWEPVFDDPDFPIRVVKRFGWAHSLQFSPDAKEQFDATPTRWPFIIHAAEGVDESARDEICRLKAAGLLRKRTVLVHAVGADAKGWNIVARSGAGVIWCPTSNQFLFGRTLSAAQLRAVPVALGTDSPLTAAGDMVDEMRAAREAGQFSASEIQTMVTEGAARVLRIRRHPGDRIAVRAMGEAPELVAVGGKIRLLAGRMAARYADDSFRPVETRNRGTVLIAGRVP